MASNLCYSYQLFGQVINEILYDLGPIQALAAETHSQFLPTQRPGFAYSIHTIF